MATYITVSGDTFDIIAKNKLGDKKYTQELMNANTKYITTVVFSAGIELTLPKIDEVDSSDNDNLPPWRSE